MIPETRDGERVRLLQLIGDLIERARSTVHTPIVSGVGSTVPSVTAASWSRPRSGPGDPGPRGPSRAFDRPDRRGARRDDRPRPPRPRPRRRLPPIGTSRDAAAPRRPEGHVVRGDAWRPTSVPSATCRRRRSGCSSTRTRSATGCDGSRRSPGWTSTTRSNASSPNCNCESSTPTECSRADRPTTAEQRLACAGPTDAVASVQRRAQGDGGRR